MSVQHPARGREQRAHDALVDVVEVREISAPMYEVQTFSDVYRVDVELGACSCPDFEYNEPPMQRCKHIIAARVEAGATPVPRLVELRPVATDGGGSWVVRDPDTGNEREFASRAGAEDAVDDLASLGVDAEIVPPGTTDGGQEVAVVEEADADPVTPDPDPATETADSGVDLPERSVAEDPLNWVPGDFVDTIDGTQAINRKGFEVLSHFYDVDVHTELQVAPEDQDHEYCRVKATATTADGRECQAFGSAHVDRGDDSHLQQEMADTRGRKRALSIATGVGAVAVSELKNEVSE